MLPAKNPIISDVDNAIDRFIFASPWPTQSRSQSTNSMIAREVWRYAKMARLLGDGFPLRVNRSFWSSADDFRSTPINRHRYRASACLKCANERLMHRSKSTSLFDHLVGAGE